MSVRMIIGVGRCRGSMLRRVAHRSGNGRQSPVVGFADGLRMPTRTSIPGRSRRAVSIDQEREPVIVCLNAGQSMKGRVVAQ
jgi:hypothetical protein